jgi:hypothetical protein
MSMRYLTGIVGGLFVAFVTYLALGFFARSTIEENGWRGMLAFSAVVGVSLLAGACSFAATVRRR